MPEPPHPELDKQAWARQERLGEFVRFYTWFTTERGYRWCLWGENDERLHPIPTGFVFSQWRDNLYAAAGSQEIGAFLEECSLAGLERARWLSSNYDEVAERLRDDPEERRKPRWERKTPSDDVDYHPAGWYPLRGAIEDLLADYYGIDRDKVEDERRAILAHIREGMHAEEAQG